MTIIWRKKQLQQLIASKELRKRARHNQPYTKDINKNCELPIKAKSSDQSLESNHLYILLNYFQYWVCFKIMNETNAFMEKLNIYIYGKYWYYLLSSLLRNWINFLVLSFLQFSVSPYMQLFSHIIISHELARRICLSCLGVNLRVVIWFWWDLWVHSSGLSFLPESDRSLLQAFIFPQDWISFTFPISEAKLSTWY